MGLLEDDSRAVGQRVAQDLLPHLSADTIGLFVFPDGHLDFGVARDNLDNFFAGIEGNFSDDWFGGL